MKRNPNRESFQEKYSEIHIIPKINLFHNMMLFPKFRIKGDNRLEKVKGDLHITKEFSIPSKCRFKVDFLCF